MTALFHSMPLKVSDTFWCSMIGEYIGLYTKFAEQLREIAGVVDEDTILHHWNLFVETTCECEHCRAEEPCIRNTDDYESDFQDEND